MRLSSLLHVPDWNGSLEFVDKTLKMEDFQTPSLYSGADIRLLIIN